MGYVTWFSITLIKGDKKEYEKFLNDLAKESGYDCIKDESSCFEAKWPSYDYDLRTVSKRHPTLTVEVSGDGEESNDLWSERWLNGKSEFVSHINESAGFFTLATYKEREAGLAKVVEQTRQYLYDAIVDLICDVPQSRIKVDLPQYTELEIQMSPFDEPIVLVMEEEAEGDGNTKHELFLKWDDKRTFLTDESIDTLSSIAGELLKMLPAD